MALERYRQLIKKAESSLDYWREATLTEFIDDVCRQMDERNISRTELSKRLGTSRAYVTKLLGGNANYTLSTMVKLALAVEGALHVHIADKAAITRWVDKYTNEEPQMVQFDKAEAGQDNTTVVSLRQSKRVGHFSQPETKNKVANYTF